MSSPRRRLKDHSLTIVFGLLLLLALVGQAVSGLIGVNQEARTGGFQQIGMLDYLTSSSFAVDLVENWQSEYLQFTLYIVLTVWLVQRGSSESKVPNEAGRRSDEHEMVGVHARPDSPAWVRAGGWRTSVYSHSLTIVMGTVFGLSWLGQAIAGHVDLDETRMRDHLDPLSFVQYLGSPDFWNRTLQNWQSEFLAIGSMAAFAIYLRERGSPESKQVGMPHSRTTSDD